MTNKQKAIAMVGVFVFAILSGLCVVGIIRLFWLVCGLQMGELGRTITALVGLASGIIMNCIGVDVIQKLENEMNK
jgi:hypothetical protein